MLDRSQFELEASRPTISGLQAIDHALHCLFIDRSRRITDEVVQGLLFEELLGALLLAKDAFESSDDEN